MTLRRIRCVCWLTLLLLLSACSAAPNTQSSLEAEDDFYETYHLKEPIDDSLRPCVMGAKACLDWMAGEQSHEFSVRTDSDGCSLLAYNEEGEGISIRSQIPMPDGSYQVYSSTEGTYDAAVRGFAATKFSTCFFYETETGRLVPSYMNGERNPEYDDLYDRWMNEKNGP